MLLAGARKKQEKRKEKQMLEFIEFIKTHYVFLAEELILLPMAVAIFTKAGGWLKDEEQI